MPRTLRLRDGSYMRRSDVESIIRYLQTMQSVEVVGFSNLGKSALLRLLGQSDVWIQELGEAGGNFLPIYVDCNRMLEMSDQGLYELILRCMQEYSPELRDLPELTAAYAALVEPSSEFQIPLNFNRGLTAAVEATQRTLVLLLDEFDEVFDQIDPRVLLNLRAMQDRHGGELVYVVAMVDPMASRSFAGEHHGEFYELFRHRTWHLAPLTHSDVDRLIRRYMANWEAPFVAADFDFIYHWAGGHPCLVESVCRLVEDALDAAGPDRADPADRWPLHREVVRQMRTNTTLRYECEKIWAGCSEAEQEAMLALFRAEDPVDEAALETLYRSHILLKVENQPHFFCRLLSEYVRRQVVQEQPESAQLWVDVDAGEVIVDGQPVETLTNLEYRLMLLLFQNAEKIVTKYHIVTSVWGEEYIDEVDDARIEKLVSRLRQKIEPDAGNPRFLTTIRGRGYRLVVA
jgi:DNA-binding winged helix-turn-helix (wHTH) protein